MLSQTRGSSLGKFTLDPSCDQATWDAALQGALAQLAENGLNPGYLAQNDPLKPYVCGAVTLRHFIRNGK